MNLEHNLKATNDVLTKKQKRYENHEVFHPPKQFYCAIYIRITR